MKNVLIVSFILMSLLACRKETAQPELSYLNNIDAGENQGVGIVYSGLINDTLGINLGPNSSKSIDIDQDGVNDFQLQFWGSFSSGHRNYNNAISTIGESSLVAPELEDAIADTIPFNTIIDDESNWSNDTCTIYQYYWDASGATSSSGLWNNAQNKYIGTRILVDDKVLYGWIRVEIAWGGRMLILVDYACTVGY